MQTFSKNAIHAKVASNAFQAFNARHTFAWKHMKNHKFAIFHMVAMDIVVQQAETLPIKVKIFEIEIAHLVGNKEKNL